jgi:hypothetical protein
MNEHVEVLLCRVVGREATPDDWRDLRGAAGAAPELWSQLADELEADAALRAHLQPDLAAADRVELPPAPARPLHAASGLLGWFCAAAIALAWLWPARGAETVQAPPAAPAALATLANDGVAVGELPHVVLTSREVEGGVEVVYVRRVVERATVRECRQLHRDEAGLPFSSPVDLASWRSPESF